MLQEPAWVDHILRHFLRKCSRALIFQSLSKSKLFKSRFPVNTRKAGVTAYVRFFVLSSGYQVERHKGYLVVERYTSNLSARDRGLGYLRFPVTLRSTIPQERSQKSETEGKEGENKQHKKRKTRNRQSRKGRNNQVTKYNHYSNYSDVSVRIVQLQMAPVVSVPSGWMGSPQETTVITVKQ